MFPHVTVRKYIHSNNRDSDLWLSFNLISYVYFAWLGRRKDRLTNNPQTHHVSEYLSLELPHVA